jgi:hypothetical protein
VNDNKIDVIVMYVFACIQVASSRGFSAQTRSMEAGGRRWAEDRGKTETGKEAYGT